MDVRNDVFFESANNTCPAQPILQHSPDGATRQASLTSIRTITLKKAYGVVTNSYATHIN